MNSVNIIGKIVEVLPMVEDPKKIGRAIIHGTIRVPLSTKDHSVLGSQGRYNIYFKYEGTPGYLERFSEKLKKDTPIGIMGKLISRPWPGQPNPYQNKKSPNTRTEETLHVAQILATNIELI